MSVKTGSCNISWKIHSDHYTLDPDSVKLLQKAKEIALTAYAPYSKFKVGAAILLENNQIVSGTNQENAAYSDGLCAERVAVFAASSQYPHQKMKGIAIAAYDEKNETFVGVTPCGSCRQVLLEYELKQCSAIKVIFSNQKGNILVFEKIKDLLPLAFNKKDHGT